MLPTSVVTVLHPHGRTRAAYGSGYALDNLSLTPAIVASLPLAAGVWRLGYQSVWVDESVSVCVVDCDPMSLLRRRKTAEASNALVRWAEAV